MNLFCVLSQERIYGPSFFIETTITGIVYLDMLQEFLIPQFDEGGQEERIHFQQDSPPPHYLGKVLEYRNIRFPDRWIESGADSMATTLPGFTPLGFSHGNSLKTECSYHLCLQM
jgi:hypothetical protein